MSEYCLEPDFVERLNSWVLCPAEPHLVINRNGLLSALGQPLTSYDGVPLYRTVVHRAGALLFGLAKAHAFHQGNKRTAWLSATLYLESKGISRTDIPQDEVVDFMVAVAERGDSSPAWCARWLTERML